MLNLTESQWFDVFNGDTHILNGVTVSKDELAKYINSMANAMFVVLRSLKVPDEVVEAMCKVDQAAVTQYLWTVQSNSDYEPEEKARIANIILWAVNTINIAATCGMGFHKDVISTGKLPVTGREKPKELN